jgi:hypothetical protein
VRVVQPHLAVTTCCTVRRVESAASYLACCMVYCCTVTSLFVAPGTGESTSDSGRYSRPPTVSLRSFASSSSPSACAERLIPTHIACSDSTWHCLRRATRHVAYDVEHARLAAVALSVQAQRRSIGARSGTVPIWLPYCTVPPPTSSNGGVDLRRAGEAAGGLEICVALGSAAGSMLSDSSSSGSESASKSEGAAAAISAPSHIMML